MIVKRIGNDVYLTWEINKKDGSPEDFSNVLDMKVYIRRSFLNKLYEQKFEVTGNVIKLHYIAAEQAGIGSYDLCAKWTKPDQMVEGGIASFVVDYRNAFKLIGFDETVPDQQDETFSSNIYEAIKGNTGNGILSIEHTSTEGLVKTYTVMFTDGTSTTFQIDDGHSPVISFTGTTILIDGVPQVDLKGDKGDSFTYADFTPEQIAELKQPATDAAQQADTAITEMTTQVNSKLGEADTKIIEMDTLMSGYDSRVVNLETGKVDKQTFADIATVKIKNLIENGDFRNGDTGWTGVQSVVDGWATCVSAGAGVYASANRATLEQFPANNILWASGTMRLDSGFDNTETKTMTIRIGGITSSYNFAPITDNPKTQEYANGTLMPFSIVENISNSRSAIVFIGVHVINTAVSISLKNLLLVNLTSTFGAGNEPTRAEMDTLVGILGVQYFEGEITLTQKQIMNWQLKLIRKNKNAIIALGGTII